MIPCWQFQYLLPTCRLCCQNDCEGGKSAAEDILFKGLSSHVIYRLCSNNLWTFSGTLLCEAFMHDTVVGGNYSLERKWVTFFNFEVIHA